MAEVLRAKKALEEEVQTLRAKLTATHTEKHTKSSATANPGKLKGGPRKWPKNVAPSKGKQAGTITKWLDRGFGFIEPFAGGDKVFVHISNVVIEARQGRQNLHQLTRWDVEFTKVKGAKGFEARKVSGPLGKALPADA